MKRDERQESDPSGFSPDSRVEGFRPLALRSCCVFSFGLDLLPSCPESFTFPLAPGALSRDGSWASLASTLTCSLGSRPGSPASSPACWGTLQKTQTLAIPGLSSPHFSACPPWEGGREGGATHRANCSSAFRRRLSRLLPRAPSPETRPKRSSPKLKA